jgi:hypothetical protein
VDEEVIMREFEEICFTTDARNDMIGASFQEKNGFAIVTKIVNGGQFDKARVQKGWRVSLYLTPHIHASFSFSSYENYSILTEPNLTKSYMTQVCRVGSKDVVSLRSMEDALRYYRDLPSACDWPAGSESEALHSSKRPIKVT